MNATLERKGKTVELEIPHKLAFLLEPHPYKVAYGGRNSLKSWSAARALLTLGVIKSTRVLCVREVQNTIADSVHQLLKDQIAALGYEAHYEVTENAIRGKRNDTLFRFRGLADLTSANVKSIEGFDRAWAEEADSITRRSWQMLLPTIFRNKGSEVWVTFNPNMDSDDTWDRFVVNPPEDAVVVEMNWRDAVACGYFTDEQERLRQRDLVYAKDDYPNIWDGKPRTVVAGAIYSSEVIDMVTDNRYRPIPYDPHFPVHRIWDLGWNDLMTVIMVQKPHPSALNVINYMEESHFGYDEMISAMSQLRYRWGSDWLPHDGDHHDPKSKTSAKKLLRGFGCKVEDIPKSDPESRIKAARMMFPRVYMDNSKKDTPPDRPDRKLGGGNLMDRLKRYKRIIPKTTQEPGGPVHDAASHGADAWGGLAEIVDRIRNDGDIDPIAIPAFENFNQGMGVLG